MCSNAFANAVAKAVDNIVDEFGRRNRLSNTTAQPPPSPKTSQAIFEVVWRKNIAGCVSLERFQTPHVGGSLSSIFCKDPLLIQQQIIADDFADVLNAAMRYHPLLEVESIICLHEHFEKER